jgi:GntR family transcriptional repressor for pyruvate dehydrogenase complex
MDELGIKAISRESLTETVRNQLTQLITDQALKPGDNLPSEGDLADRFGVSRPVIREVLRGLSAIGVVEISQGRRARIRQPSAEHLETFLRFSVFSSENGLEEAVEFRRLLETQIAILAVERITDDELEQLEQVIKGMEQALGTVKPWLDADLEFHTILARSTNNSFMTRIVEALGGLFWEGMRFMHIKRGPENAGPTLERHKNILKALKLRDPDAVKEAMNVHFEYMKPMFWDPNENTDNLTDENRNRQ